jgi:hypothetical protein
MCLAADKGGDLETVHKSQRRRHADASLVDQVASTDTQYRAGGCCCCLCEGLQDCEQQEEEAAYFQ